MTGAAIWVLAPASAASPMVALGMAQRQSCGPKEAEMHPDLRRALADAHIEDRHREAARRQTVRPARRVADVNVFELEAFELELLRVARTSA